MRSRTWVTLRHGGAAAALALASALFGAGLLGSVPVSAAAPQRAVVVQAAQASAVVVDASGRATFSAVDDRLTLGSGSNSLFGPNGTALVIHADPDDQLSNPAGNSGDRIACGVITRGVGTKG